MSASEEVVALLKSIDASLKKLVTQQRGQEIASDRDLDGQYGNPLVKFEPRDWTGEPCKGRHFSECPAPFLDMLAETFDYFASQAEEKNEEHNGKPVAPYKRRDAARARGWAKRVREGKVPARSATDDFGGGDSDF